MPLNAKVDKRTWKKRKLMYTLLILLVAVIYIGSKAMENDVHFKPGYSGGEFVNPYMGFAPPADGGPFSQPHSLVFANITWSDFEPEKGVYDFESLEKKINLDYWESKNIRLILRVVLDYPGKKKHKDIPEWLYEEIDKEGIWYEHEWGSGFSPNYDNKRLIYFHEKMIKALANRYNQDPAIAFIELGSLGHWGEWHTLQQDGIYIPFPKLPVAETYVDHYTEYLDGKLLLMRRPHQIAIKNNIGLYNDMFGRYDHTIEEFLDWVDNGYEFWLTDERNPPMKAAWKTAPIGGEFAPTKNWGDYFSEESFKGTMEQLKLTHVSWLGPSSPAYYPVEGELNEHIHQFLGKIGYHFRLRQSIHPKEVESKKDFELTLEWENTGVAPFYFPWPLEISLADEKGDIVYSQISAVDIRKWLPGKSKMEEQVKLSSSKCLKGQYTLCVAILDP